jgi:phosphate transport system permease protein
VRAVRIAVNNLAGVPSIVFGVFGLGFFVYSVGGTVDQLFFSEQLPTPTFGTGGILWASLTLALMTVPVVIVATEEALAAVPRGAREGSLACGASKWQTIQNIVLPASSSGILTGLILQWPAVQERWLRSCSWAWSSSLQACPWIALFPFFHLDRKFMHLGFHIYDLDFSRRTPRRQTHGLCHDTILILLVVLLNLSAIILRERLRRKYSTGAF